MDTKYEVRSALRGERAQRSAYQPPRPQDLSLELRCEYGDNAYAVDVSRPLAHALFVHDGGLQEWATTTMR